MRLFIAIPLKHEIKNAVGRIQDEFRTRRITGNYVPAENLHITLAFIGDYNDPEAVLEVMEKLEFAPFELTVDRLGCFDDLWWAGTAENPALEKLVRSLRRALAQENIPFDKKSFKAHITFLRKARNTEGKSVDVHFETAVMRVEKISLMRSQRGKNGMIYSRFGSVSAR